MYRVRGIAREMMFEVRFDYRMVFLTASVSQY